LAIVREEAAGTGNVEADDARTGRRRRRANPLLADADGQGPSASEQTTAEERSHGVVCTVGLCPICTLVTALGEARPELMEHLLAASREVLLALKLLIDARLQDVEPAPPPDSLERITIE
jgi:hypothetical protein